MSSKTQRSLEERVVRAAEAALEHHKYVSAIGVLTGMGLLAATHVEDWRKGRVPLSKPPEIVVFRIVRDTQCAQCRTELSRGSFLLMEADRPLCMTCADLDHLVFLPSGDTALTRRAKKHSTLSAVVVEFSRTRRRYERQGILVQEAALDRAEEECLSDADLRAARRARATLHRVEEDKELIELMRGLDRASAREQVQDRIDAVLRAWQTSPSGQATFDEAGG